MRTVKEISDLTGISVRTLHYYDEIGLLKPTEKSDAGYRLYDDKALETLQQVLFFREFDIPLKEIKAVMDNPALERNQILQMQRKMLVAKKERMERLIASIDDILKGENRMDFAIFSKTEVEEMFQTMLEHMPDNMKELAIKEFGSVEEWKKHYIEVVSSEEMQKGYAKVVEWYGGILVVDILRQTYSAIINCGIYYMTYVLGKAELLGTFSGAINLALIIGLAFLPAMVAKYKGYYKLNFSGYLIAAAGRGIVIIAGYMGSVPLMLVGTAIGAIGMAPWQGNLNALVAECSEHTFLQYGKRIDGTMYSCTSMGLKIGSGLGTAIVGWLLDFGGFDGKLAVQSQSCINMLHFMYLWLPMIINILVALLLTQLNVEKANQKLREQKAIEAK